MLKARLQHNSALSSFRETQSLHWAARSDREGHDRLANLLRSLSGVDLPSTEKNRVLMACRLAPLMRKHGLQSYRAYELLLLKGDRQVVREFISVMTTHTTDFFREGTHFDLLPAVLKEIANNKVAASPLRVWCAAASSGQEPYTMLFTLLESMPRLNAGSLKFLASDIDRVALLKGNKGLYSLPEMQKVPPRLREKYFEKTGKLAGFEFYVKEKFRKLVTFAEFNLMNDPYPFQHGFDLIFCRNVMIYFERSEALRVADRLVKSLAPGGFLFTAHSETAFIRRKNLTVVAPAVFQKI